MSRLPLRWAVVVWVIIVAAVGVRVLLKPHSNTVFPIFADAGRNWLAGVDLYGPPKPGLDQFRYSPAITSTIRYAARLIGSPRLRNKSCRSR